MNDANINSVPWEPLGEAAWRELGARLGATDRQIAFAACRARKLSRMRSAFLAGYVTSLESETDKARARKYGSDVDKTKIVRKLLVLANPDASDVEIEEAEEKKRPPVTRAEAREILSELARDADPSVRLRACEALSKMADEDAEAAAANPYRGMTMRGLLDRAGRLGDVGVIYALFASQKFKEYDIEFDPAEHLPTPEARRRVVGLLQGALMRLTSIDAQADALAQPSR